MWINKKKLHRMIQSYIKTATHQPEFIVEVKHIVNTMDSEDRKYFISQADEIYVKALKKAEAISKDIKFLTDIVEAINAMQIPKTYPYE